MPNLEAVIASLNKVADINRADAPAHPARRRFRRGRRTLNRETHGVFGEQREGRRVRLMVTMPTAAAEDAALVHKMVAHGMDCARINCAHDTPEQWQRMIDHVRRAEQATGRPVKIAMDLGGPKPRTADLINKGERRIERGDMLLLTTRQTPVSDEFDFQVRCTLPEALEPIGENEEVWFDDGKIGFVVDEVRENGLVLRVTQAREKGERLKEDKGINFPDTVLQIDALTEKDLNDLDFVVEHADIINFSFVQRVEDIEHLQRELARRCDDPYKFAVLAKIETALGVKNLPEIMVAAAGKQPFGVMIARGDLAVEIGYDRLAEMQEEILWICEAAHVPVVWATQVLETLAKKGRPSRAEMTDAAMAERADCVMLNKGPYIVEAIDFMVNVIERMKAHQSKKSAQLRALSSWT
jgi:pyruvate kinase